MIFGYKISYRAYVHKFDTNNSQPIEKYGSYYAFL